MTENLVLRIERPYFTESEFLQSENWTITKKSAFLIGAPAHPEGTIVRCELVLAGGIQLLVAEGAVAKYVQATAGRPAGLVVRYRRMTPASSQFVNRALSAREAAEASSPSAAEHGPAVAKQETQNNSQARVSPVQPKPAVRVRAPGNALNKSHRSSREVLSSLSSRQPRRVEAPPDRATLLSRLRMRAADHSDQ
jgi:hypothetical protein